MLVAACMGTQKVLPRSDASRLCALLTITCSPNSRQAPRGAWEAGGRTTTAAA